MVQLDDSPTTATNRLTHTTIIPTVVTTLAARQLGDTATNFSLTYAHLARLLRFPNLTLKPSVLLVSLLRTINLSKADFPQHVHLTPFKRPFQYLSRVTIHSPLLR